MNSFILRPLVMCVLYIAAGIQGYFSLTHWQRQTERLPWQLLASRMHRHESLTISINQYPHILCGTIKVVLQYKKCARTQQQCGKEHTDEGWPNASYTLQICNSCSFSAAVSEVIGPKCSQQLTYGNDKHMRNEKPEVKGLMLWSNGLAWVLFDISKLQKWMSFLWTLGWIRSGISGSASLLKWT